MNNKPSKQAIRKALTGLNWSYGTGDIISVDYAGGTYRVQRQYGQATYHFHVTDRTVKARGHQKSI